MSQSSKTILFENLQFDHNSTVNLALDNTPATFPIHWHTFGEVILAMEDNIVMTVQSRNYRLNKNDILFIWPGELHDTLSSPGDGSYMILQFANNMLSYNTDMLLMQSYILNRHYVSCSAAPEYSEKIIQYMNEIRVLFSKQLPLTNLRISVIMQQIFLILYDYCTEPNAIDPQEIYTSKLNSLQAVTRACCYITENCEKNLSLDTVADYAGISKYHFSRIFKEHTKTSFCDYLALQRIQKAILLFENPDISIAEAAFQAGFGSIASFNRCFRKYKNCTPSDYRTLLQKEMPGTSATSI